MTTEISVEPGTPDLSIEVRPTDSDAAIELKIEKVTIDVSLSTIGPKGEAGPPGVVEWSVTEW